MLTFLSLVLAVAAARCERVPFEFAEGVRSADTIVCGEVVRVLALPLDAEALAELERIGGDPWTHGGVKVAEIAVTRVFKGDPTLTKLVCFAERIDVCDESDGKVGDRGYFFLERDGWRDPLRALLADECRSELGVAAILDLGVGGAARVLEVVHDDKTLCDLGAHMRPPTVAKATKVGRDELFEPADIERAIVETVEKQRKPLLELALSWSAAGEAPWRLRMNREGRVRIDGLAATAGGAFECKLAFLRELERVLPAGELPENGSSIAVKGATRCAFELTLHASSGPRTYTIQVDPAAPAASEGARLEGIWLGLRRSFDFEPLPAEVVRTFDVQQKRAR
jgi:hypothetical protein